MARAGWWWIDRWRKSTAYTDMTLAEQGAYRNLLDELWLRGGFLPSNERILAKVCGDATEWPKVRSAVMQHFVLTDQGYRNETHDEVSNGSSRAIESQRLKGKIRAEGASRGPAGRFQPSQPKDQPPDEPGTQPTDQPKTSRASSRKTSLPDPDPLQEPEPDPERLTRAVARAAGPASWNQEAVDDYQNGTGGVVDKTMAIRITTSLKKLVERVAKTQGLPFEAAWPKVRPFWQRYCQSPDVKFGPESFSRNPRQVLGEEKRGNVDAIMDAFVRGES